MTIYLKYDYNMGGLGDFFRALLALEVYFETRPGRVQVYIPGHPLKDCIECETAPVDAPILNFSYEHVPAGDLLKYLESGRDYIFLSNLYKFVPWDALTIGAMTRCPSRGEPSSLVQYKAPVLDRIRELRPGFPYVSMHIRCGDRFMNEGSRQVQNDSRLVPYSAAFYTNLSTGIKFLSEHYRNAPIYVFSDVDFHGDLPSWSLLSGRDLNFFPTAIHHTASISYGVGNPCVDALVEFELLGMSECIVTFNTSGFSFWSAFLHRTPIFLCRGTASPVPLEPLRALD